MNCGTRPISASSSEIHHRASDRAGNAGYTLNLANRELPEGVNVRGHDQGQRVVGTGQGNSENKQPEENKKNPEEQGGTGKGPGAAPMTEVRLPAQEPQTPEQAGGEQST